MEKIRISAVALLLSAGAALPLSAQPAQGYPYGDHMGWGWGWSGMIFGPIMMIVFIGITVALVVLIVRWLSGSGQGPSTQAPAAPGGKTPLDILKERFARGEIDEEDFRARRDALGE